MWSHGSWGRRRIQAHQFLELAACPLSPDGARVATTTGQYLPGGWKYEPAPESEPSVKVFDTATGEAVATFSHTPPVLSCAFSPDGQHLAAANIMGEVRVWNLQAPGDGKLIAQFTSPDFTSWGTIKTHHYCGGIYGLAFSLDCAVLLCCGMGPMGDPMAGNGKMTWQRWNWQKGERIDQIKDGQHGSGLMESVAWHPSGTHFIMAGRQAQGTWNAALFSSADGSLVHSIDTKRRITHAQFTADGQSLILSGATGQEQPKQGVWPPWGRVQIFKVEAWKLTIRPRPSLRPVDLHRAGDRLDLHRGVIGRRRRQVVSVRQPMQRDEPVPKSELRRTAGRELECRANIIRADAAGAKSRERRAAGQTSLPGRRRRWARAPHSNRRRSHRAIAPSASPASAAPCSSYSKVCIARYRPVAVVVGLSPGVSGSPNR